MAGGPQGLSRSLLAKSRVAALDSGEASLSVMSPSAAAAAAALAATSRSDDPSVLSPERAASRGLTSRRAHHNVVDVVAGQLAPRLAGLVRDVLDVGRARRASCPDLPQFLFDVVEFIGSVFAGLRSC
jgi:hypothetical protein